MARQLTLKKWLFKKSPLELVAERLDHITRLAANTPRIYIMFSGGKDSAALLAALPYTKHAIRKAVIVYIQVAGNTHPENVATVYRFVERLGFGVDGVCVVVSPPNHTIRNAVYGGCRVIHVVRFSDEGVDFFDAMVSRGFPLSMSYPSRWCRIVFKNRVVEALPRPWFVVDGVRAVDSPARRRRVKQLVYTTTLVGYRLIVARPLFDMSDEEVWEVLREAGVDKLLSTYERYGSSLNCSVCPLTPVEKLRRVAEGLARDAVGRAILLRALAATTLARVVGGTRTEKQRNVVKSILEEVTGLELTCSEARRILAFVRTPPLIARRRYST